MIVDKVIEMAIIMIVYKVKFILSFLSFNAQFGSSIKY